MRRVWVKVDNVCTREVAREKDIENIWEGGIRRRSSIESDAIGLQSPPPSHWPLILASQNVITAERIDECVDESFRKS